MSQMPDESALSFQTGSDFKSLLDQNTESSILQYMQVLGQRLKAKDARWGYLTKTPGEKHLTLPSGQFISVDSFCWKDTLQVVDCIGNAVETSPASPSWGEKPRRPENLWYEIGGSVPTPNPPPSNDCNCQEEISNLQSQINALTAKVAELSQSNDLTGRKISLQAESNGRWLCADKEKNRNEPPVIANRDSPGPWETFKILEK